MFDDVFGSSSNPAVPGGSVTKPLMIALLALLASRYMSGGPKGSPSPGSFQRGANRTGRVSYGRAWWPRGLASNFSRVVLVTRSIPG